MPPTTDERASKAGVHALKAGIGLVKIEDPAKDSESRRCWGCGELRDCVT